MAKLPELPYNNTGIASLQYTCNSQAHTLEFRLGDTKTSADAAVVAGQLATALKPLMLPGDSFYGLRWQNKDALVSFPVSWTTIVGTGSGSAVPSQAPRFLSWTGRSLAGRRTRVTFFTQLLGADNNYRYNVGDVTQVGSVLAILDDSTRPVVAKDGADVVWNQYANTGFNSYWQREARPS